MDTMEQNAPCKQKYTRGNHLPFMNKIISKDIIKRTRVRNQSLKNGTDESKSWNTKQSNYCVLLLRKIKTQYYRSLDIKMLLITRRSGKQLNLFFQTK